MVTPIQTLWGSPTKPEPAVPELIQVFEICPPHMPMAEPGFPLLAAEHQALHVKEPQMTLSSHITETYSSLLGEKSSLQTELRLFFSTEVFEYFPSAIMYRISSHVVM